MSGAVFDLRKLVPNLPKAITKESLERMTPEEQAALLRSLEQGTTAVDREVTRAETVIAQETQALQRIEAEIHQEFGATTPEELEQQIESNTLSVVDLWSAVEALIAA